MTLEALTNDADQGCGCNTVSTDMQIDAGDLALRKSPIDFVTCSD